MRFPFPPPKYSKLTWDSPLRPDIFSRDLPLANPEDLELIAHDPAKSIPIDNMQREIRFYEETATCVMGEGDIRELSFQAQGTRRVILDEDTSIIPALHLDNKEYTDFVLDGITHKIKIGAPTRELWIDGQWYECYFNNEIRIRLGQRFHTLFLEGPAPVVKHDVLRTDLCAGFVQLIINGDLTAQHRLYLDAKPQKIVIDGKPHVLRLVQALRTLLINGHPFK